MAISGRHSRFRRSLSHNSVGCCEIAPQGHFLALRAQGATSAFGLLAMTSLGALHIRRKYLQICSCQRRSLTAATDAIGACHFNDSLYGSGVHRRARLSPPLQRANSCLARLRIFVKMYLTFREQADIIKMWKPRRLPQT